MPVPTLRGLKELPTMEEPALGTTTKRDRSETSRPSVVLGVLFLLIFLAVPTAIFLTYRRLSMDTSHTRAAEQQEVVKHLDAARPHELSEVWNGYSTTPLGPPTKPDFYLIEREARALEWQIGIACSIALLAAIAAGAIIVANHQARENRRPT